MCMQGLLGLGLGDAPTAQEAVAAAHLKSFSNLIVVPLYRGHTIFHHIEHEYHFIKVGRGSRLQAHSLSTKRCIPLEECTLCVLFTSVMVPARV